MGPIERTYAKGSYLFIEGDEDVTSVFLIKQGRVANVCGSTVLSAALSGARDGDLVGFISSFSGKPRISSAVAIEETIAVEIHRDVLLRTLHEQSEICLKVLNAFSRALLQYDNLLMTRNPRNILESPSTSLRQLGEYYADRGNHTIARYAFQKYVQLYPDSDHFADVIARLGRLGWEGETVADSESPGLFLEDGRVVFCEYEPGTDLYLVDEGQVKILKQNNDKTMLLAVLTKGAVFGELALLTSAPRSATAVSYGGARLTRVDRELFRSLLGETTDLGGRILQSIALRLWFNHVRLSHLSFKHPITRLFAFLEGKLLEAGVSLLRTPPHSFPFGLGDLIDMVEVPYTQDSPELAELLGSPALSFGFGKITVTNPREFHFAVLFHIQRDHYPATEAFPQDRLTNPLADLSQLPDHWPDEAVSTADLVGSSELGLGGILSLLEDADAQKRCSGLLRLGILGEKAGEAARRVAVLLSDPVKVVRKNAAKCLTEILHPRQALDELERILKTGRGDARGAAAFALGKMNLAESSEVIHLLTEVLKDPDPSVRIAGARSLGDHGVDARRAMFLVARLLEDAESSVRIVALGTLDKVAWRDARLDEVVEAVRKVSKSDDDPTVRDCAKDVYQKLRSRGQR